MKGWEHQSEGQLQRHEPKPDKPGARRRPATHRRLACDLPWTAWPATGGWPAVCGLPCVACRVWVAGLRRVAGL